MSAPHEARLEDIGRDVFKKSIPIDLFKSACGSYCHSNPNLFVVITRKKFNFLSDHGLRPPRMLSSCQQGVQGS